MSVSASGEIVFTVKVNGISNPIELLQLLSRSNIQTSVPIETEVPRKKRTRHESKERLAMLKTLKNSLLFSNLCEKLEKLNGSSFDPDMIDRTMEVSEALGDLKKKWPALIIDGKATKDEDYRKEYRAHLESLGLTNKQQQDLVIARLESDEPYTDAQILAIVNATNGVQEEPIPA
jgi:hypothetical protein